MARKRNRNKLSKPTLPAELCAVILSKLPTKPILTFRGVSRLWRSIIDHPHFILTHLKNRQNNQDKSQLLVFEPHEEFGFTQLCTFRRSHTFRLVSKLVIETRMYTHFQPVGYVNGVLCLKKYVSETRFSQILLWNPSIKKALNIPLPQMANVTGQFDIDCAFGYDPITNDFKLVTSLHSQGEPFVPSSVEIFSLRTNSWRNVILEHKHHVWFKDAPKVYHDGFIYWMSIDIMKSTPKGKYPHFVSFDVGNEVVSYIGLPDCELINTFDHERFPVILRKSIALVDIYHDYSNIWVMGESSNWTKQYTIRLPLLQKCLYLKVDGNLLFGGEEGVFSYNLENQNDKVLAKSYKVFPLLTGTYMESLMLLDGLDDREIFTFS